MRISRYWKALMAGLMAGSGAVATAMNDDVITGTEGITIAAAVVGALGLTWAVPNHKGGKTPTVRFNWRGSDEEVARLFRRAARRPPDEDRPS